MALHYEYCTKLGVTNRNVKFPCVEYYHRKSWTMSPYSRLYFEINNPAYELMNYKRLIYMCHDVEYIMFDYFEKNQDNII